MHPLVYRIQLGRRIQRSYQRLVVLADADDLGEGGTRISAEESDEGQRETHKDSGAKLGSKDCRLHARLDASALESDADAERKACLGFNLGRDVLGFNATLDKDRLDAGNELLGKVEAGLGDVGDDDGSSSGSASSEEADESDGSGATVKAKERLTDCCGARPQTRWKLTR
jgi:hypothetical protein